ncbi:MAG TPA: MFS transporter [Anaerolineaceae bacterium]|nr:MFS transporter [Anaerolineaceae bacterium]HPN53915.1 MFS transporter [Anaerolineaceae bacterium]
MSRDLLLVTISLAIWGLGEGMFINFQPLYLQQLGADPLAIGAILGMAGAMMTVAQVPAGYLADRVGRRPLMWASWIFGAAAAWAMALATSLNVFVIGLLLYTLTSFVLAPMNSYITHARGKWSVGRALTFVSAMYNVGAVVGPLVGGFIGQRWGIQTIYLVAAVILAVSTAIVLLVSPQPLDQHEEQHGRTHLLRNTRFLMMLGVTFVAMFAMYLPQPFTPNFLQQQHSLSIESIGQLGSIGSLGNAGLMLMLGHLNAPLAFFIGQALVLIYSFLLWQSGGFVGFAGAYFALGGYRLARSMLLAVGRSLVQYAEVGLAFGLIETVNGLAVMLAPMLAGWIFDRSPVQVYPVSLGLVLLSMLISGLYLRKHRAVPQYKEESAA